MVSVPENLTIKTIDKEIKVMLDTGKLWIENGLLKQKDVRVSGRKVPLLEIRQWLLLKQEKYMRATSD